jgi:hypothetical protein
MRYVPSRSLSRPSAHIRSQAFYDRTADALAALPSLRAFELSGMSWPGPAASAAEPSSWRPAHLPLAPPPAGHLPAPAPAAPATDEYDFFDFLP